MTKKELIEMLKDTPNEAVIYILDSKHLADTGYIFPREIADISFMPFENKVVIY